METRTDFSYSFDMADFVPCSLVQVFLHLLSFGLLKLCSYVVKEIPGGL